MILVGSYVSMSSNNKRLIEILSMFKSILFVCIGNVCRSPMAEGFFRHQLQQHQSSIKTASAGLHALVGEPAVEEARIVMQQVGVDISAHRAQQVSEPLLIDADLILTMEEGYKNALHKACPSARGKVFLLGHWSDFEIYDPFRQSSLVFEQTYLLIRQSWDDWRSKLVK